MANKYINTFNYNASGISSDYEMLCLTLYWTEGSKHKKHIEVTNSDPKIIEMFSHFLLKVCNVEQKKLKGRLQIHEGNDLNKAVDYWAALCNIEKTNFSNRILKVIKSHKTNKHPLGIFSVKYNSVGLRKLLDEKIANLRKSGIFDKKVQIPSPIKLCEASLSIGGVFGCMLPFGHKGPHLQSGDGGSFGISIPFSISWMGDVRDVYEIIKKKEKEQEKR